MLDDVLHECLKKIRVPRLKNLNEPIEALMDEFSGSGRWVLRFDLSSALVDPVRGKRFDLLAILADEAKKPLVVVGATHGPMTILLKTSRSNLC